jgi:hypothetical protein
MNSVTALMTSLNTKGRQNDRARRIWLWAAAQVLLARRQWSDVVPTHGARFQT